MSLSPDQLRQRLLEVIGRGTRRALDDTEFDDLACAVFRHQYSLNAAYRAYCDRRRVSPGSLRSWLQIPAVPTDAFKAATLLCGDPAEATAVFRTSGTTAGRERRGTHAFLDLALYDAALLRGFEDHLLTDGARLPILALVPPSSEQPESSLSHMMSTVIERLGAQGSDWFVSAEAGLRMGALLSELESAEVGGRPLLLAGTSLAFAHLFEALQTDGRRFRLPAGSRAMDTGGSKGQARNVSRDDLLARFTEALAIPEHLVVNEYGMTEMSSQLYASGRDVHRSPPWVRSRAFDPETLDPLERGAVGVLRHWDLANLDSVAVLQTADLGRVTPDGLELMGRAVGAEARGCSIAMDELLTAMGESEPQLQGPRRPAI